MVRAFGVAGLLAVAALLCTGVAGAEQSSEAEARTHFLRGVELYDDQEYEAALAEFTWAATLRPHYAINYNIAQCYAQLGRYAPAIRHFEQYLDGGGTRVDGPRRQEVESELQRLRSLFATVTIEVNVDGAEVLVDGQPVGTSPLEQAIDMRAGERALEARLDGYLTARAQITVVGGVSPEPVVLELEEIRREGQLRVESQTPEARVYVDQAEMGPVPWQGRLRAGEHVLEVRADRYVSVTREVAIAPEESRTIEINLLPEGQPARLQVDAQEGATVFLEGRRLGATPLRPIDLPAGAHRLRVEHEGYLCWEGDVALQEGQAAVARVYLDNPSEGLAQVWFWTALALSAATFASAAVMTYLAFEAEDDLRSHERAVAAGNVAGTESEYRQRANELADNGRSYALVADVLWLTAGIGAASTLVLGLFTRFRPPRSEMELEVSGASVPSGALLLARGRF